VPVTGYKGEVKMFGVTFTESVTKKPKDKNSKSSSGSTNTKITSIKGWRDYRKSVDYDAGVYKKESEDK